MRPQAIPDTCVPIVPDEALVRLRRASEGGGFRRATRRRHPPLLLDTGIRLGELTGLDVDDVDFDYGVVQVVGKGRRPRAVPFGLKTGPGDRSVPRGASPSSAPGSAALWQGRKGRLAESGIAQLLARRYRQARLPQIHPHQFQHTFAHSGLAPGKVGDLVRVAGWRSRETSGPVPLIAGRRWSRL
jgi:integrase